MNLGLENMAVYVPEGRINPSSFAKTWTIRPETMQKIGIEKVSRKSPEQRSSDLAVEAFRSLQRKQSIDLRAIDLCVVVTQTPDKNIPHVSALLQHKLDLPKTCIAFDVSHGCAGYVYGLAICQSFMRDQGLRTGLLFTSDPYSEIVDLEDRKTAQIFGDAATVTLLSERPRWTTGKFSFHTDGSRAKSLTLENGKLFMDGTDIFNFAARLIPGEIEKTLYKNNIEKADVDAFLIHSGSRYVVDSIAKHAGLPPEKVPFGIEEIGNTVSSSLPLLLEKIFFGEAKTVFATGFGVGLSSASTILKRV